MRFSFWPGLQWSRGPRADLPPPPERPWEAILEAALRAERTGWDGIWIADHFMPDAEDTTLPWMECWTAMAGLAAAVPRVRIGSLVTGNTYRHPAVLAKMAANVDHISGGRAVLGLGAGWQENEHLAYGLPFPPLRERLDRLEEACELIQALFRETLADFEGRYYGLRRAALSPKPLQRPLPLVVGGSGEKRTLRIAARFGDEWNAWGTPERMRHLGGVLDRHCEDLGRDPASIRRSACALLFMTSDETVLSALRAAQIPEECLIGTPAEIADQVARYHALGVDELIVPDFTLGPPERRDETMDRFIEEVAAPFRGPGRAD